MNLAEKLESIDTHNMYQHLKDFPEQVLKSIEIAKNSPFFQNNNKRFIIIGMGGSAISGDLLQTYFRNSKFNEIEIFVNRNYLLMKQISPEINFIASSYSGNTEETLSAYSFVKRYSNNIIGIGTGGKLKEQLLSDGYDFINIPSGLQPREALGYSFFPLLLLIVKSVYDHEIFESLINSLNSLANFLKDKSFEYSNLNGNKAIDFAKSLKNKIVIVYAPEETLIPVALRFKAQLQENSKNLAFAGPIPEVCHNEINSFIFPKDLIDRLKVVLLNDVLDHPKNKMRIETIYNLLNKIVEVEIIQSHQEDFLFRLLDLIYFFDWVSFYLAMENNIDPTPISIISELKKRVQSK